MTNRYVYLEVNSNLFLLVCCNDCGALVGTAEQHDAFHDALDTQSTKLRKLWNKVRNLK